MGCHYCEPFCRVVFSLSFGDCQRAPVDLREAKRQNCNFQMTFLRRSDFNNPQVAAMVQQKKIVSLAQPNPETYLVGVLQPRGPRTARHWRGR